jgi:hypothetical protein
LPHLRPLRQGGLMNRWQMLNKRKRGDQDGNGEDDTSMWLNIGLWLGVPGER